MELVVGLRRRLLYAEDSEQATKMPLSVTTRKCEPDVTVIEIGGRLALDHESGQIEAAMLKALDEGARRIVIDLSGVSYIDSAGVGMVTYCFNKILQQNGRLAVSGAHGLALEVFRIVQIDSMIPFYPDLAWACAALITDGTSA